MVKQKELQLKKCPMCGGIATFETGNVFTYISYFARCNKCGVRTPFEITGEYRRVDEMKRVYVSEDDAKRRVSGIWNRRISNG